MNVGDVLRITLVSLYGSVNARNVFYYLVTSLTGAVTLNEVADDWFNSFDESLKAVTNEGITFSAVEMLNFTNGIDFDTLALTGELGGVAGEILPPYAAWGFRYNRASAMSRHGYKRFIGVSESQQQAGVATAGAQTLLGNLAAVLDNTVVIGGASGNANIEPRIMSFWLGKQLRETPVDFPVASVSYVGLTTQNTRKFGRGA